MAAHDPERIRDRHCADCVDEDGFRFRRRLFRTLVHERLHPIDLATEPELSQSARNRLHLLRQLDSIHRVIAVSARLRKQVGSANAPELERLLYGMRDRSLTLSARSCRTSSSSILKGR